MGHSNLGYGFVNFSRPEDAAACRQMFMGYSFQDTKSQKVCHVEPARIQGFRRNISHFRKGSGLKNVAQSPFVLQSPAGTQVGAGKRIAISLESLVVPAELGSGDRLADSSPCSTQSACLEEPLGLWTADTSSTVDEGGQSTASQPVQKSRAQKFR